MDKDFAITAIIMMLSSMQPAPATDQNSGMASTPLAIQDIKNSHAKQQRMHEQQGCGDFVLYG